MQSPSEWRQITTPELRAFLFEAHLLSLTGAVIIVYALRHFLNVGEPYALSIAFFWLAIAPLPAFTVRTRERGKPMLVMRYVAVSAIGSVLFIGAWFLLGRVM
jgi:hypothetical protein